MVTMTEALSSSPCSTTLRAKSIRFNNLKFERAHVFSFQDLLEFPPPLDSLLSVVKGEKWRRIRSTLSPSFSALKMKRMVPLMNQACDTFMKKLENVADRDESVDIYE